MNIFDLGINDLNAQYFHGEVTRQLKLKTFVKKFNKYLKEEGNINLRHFPTSDLSVYALSEAGYADLVEGYDFLIEYKEVQVTHPGDDEPRTLEVLNIPEFWEQVGQHGSKVLLKTVERILTISKVDTTNVPAVTLAYAIIQCVNKLQVNLTMANNLTFQYTPDPVHVLDEYSINLLTLEQRQKLASNTLDKIESAYSQYHDKYAKLHSFTNNLLQLNKAENVDVCMFEDMLESDYPIQLLESYGINYKDVNAYGQLILRLRKEESLTTLKILVGLSNFEPLTECSYVFKLIFSDVIKSVFRSAHIKLEV